jgi:hypothetical protein
MIVRRYGRNMESVRPNFDPLAMTELGFRRDREWSMPADDFADSHVRESLHELVADAEGDVQIDVETRVVRDIESQLLHLEEQAPPGHLLVIENEQGVDQAKTGGRQSSVLVGGENRLHFHWTVDPPLKVGIYRPRS